MRILLAEDEPGIAGHLQQQLCAAGYVVDHAADGEEIQFLGETEPYDAVILDLGLPGRNGLAVLRAWRSAGRQFPVLILTARGSWREKVEGIDAGADDYLAKPFGVAELLARVRALLRRALRPPQATACIAFGDVELDLEQRRVTRGGAPVHLTPIEFRLLGLLATAAGRVVTQRQLLTGAWGPNHVEHAHYLRVYMAGLRRKLEPDPRLPVHILTEPGVGYRLVPEPLSAARTPASAPPAG